MPRYKKNILIFIILSLLIIGGLLLYHNQKESGKREKAEISGKKILSLVTEFSKRLERRWKWGDIEGLYEKKALVCPGLLEFNPSVGKSYLACNENYLQCFFLKPYQMGDYSFHLTRVQGLAFTFELKKEGRKLYGFDLKLLKKCHEILLPEGEFLLESLGGKKWSSFGRKIYIDKFLVSRGEYEKTQEPVAKRGRPLLGLGEKEQKSFCQSRGKSLLRAHIFEAATRFPPSYQLAPYPWGSHSQNSKFSLSQEVLKVETCRKAYMRECKKLAPWKSFDTDSVSWAGLHDVFGGPSEVFSNIYERDRKYKKADWSISIKSPEAKIGFKSEVENESELGFRCYREVAP